MKAEPRSRSATLELRVSPLSLVVAELPQRVSTESVSVTCASARVRGREEISLPPAAVEAKVARYNGPETDFDAAEAISAIDSSGKCRSQSMCRCASVFGCASRL